MTQASAPLLSRLRNLAAKTPLRSLYRSMVLRRQIGAFWQSTPDDERRGTFYRQFVKPGDVVFDVGANFGNRAKVFHRLGAVVVAVEPQARCADFLNLVFRNAGNFRLVRAALGAAPGQLEMRVSDVSAISSLSPDGRSSAGYPAPSAPCPSSSRRR